MKKFYAVTAGDYSDYHIVAITDEKEKAERIKYLYERCSGCYNGCYEEANIEEYCDTMQDGLARYSVCIYSSGSLWVKINFDTLMESQRDINMVKKNSCGSYFVDVKAKDKDHAIKIASDLIAQYKAQENGIA